MRIDRAIKRRKKLSLTSLIDVIFLLLLFFMLSSTFTRFAEVDIVAGRAGTPVATTKAPDIFIRLEAGDDWKINGAALDIDAAMIELQRLEDLGASTAVVVVRPQVSSQELVDALERISKSANLKVAVAG
ncbi:biopolymer transporter ExbD [Hoeflea prorocentri]|uniref:Biopolymer transporter ExbD n=1 Tax=Hoeflea prorocentri TaxID=1922333 RepID=A0A9X3UE07_9HYPH|nr:biopolymer transporter ExbD [Hoeflea prorocentri]MCY6379683.1 biopolymer transporter ExbD [Hoeflea prorocentri]MDA5397483.1 biopolymer transporter ExbD [Hoeflea prorocentri]